jgi:hypothetical protein
VNTNGLAKHYGALSGEERFRLIMAAAARGDEAERDRLVNAAHRTMFAVGDHAPFARALQELFLMLYIELVDWAAGYLECIQWAEDDALLDWAGGERGDAAADAGAEDGDTSGGRSADLAMVQGYVLKVHSDGWKLFCERLNVPPALTSWAPLPGHDRLEEALELAEEEALDRDAVRAVMNARRRAAGEPELADTDMISAESCADFLEARLRWHAHGWGGGAGR